MKLVGEWKQILDCIDEEMEIRKKEDDQKFKIQV